MAGLDQILYEAMRAGQITPEAVQQSVGMTTPGKPSGTYGTLVQQLTDLPAGSYDPSLLYQSQNANLGQTYAAGDYDTTTGRINADYGTNLGRLGEDYATNTTRAGEDYGTSSGRLSEDYGINSQRTAQNYDWQGQDLSTGHSRSLSDLLTQYSQSNEDRQRAYGRLGNEQTQSAAAHGLASGGALAQAMRKRAENQQFEQGRSDLAYGTATGRENEDYGTNSSRLGVRREQDLGDLSRNYGRSSADLYTNYTRGTQDASTDYTRATQDLGTNKDRGLADALTGYSRAGQSNALYQGGLYGTAAQQANQYTSQYGTPSGYVTYNGQLYKKSPTGQLIPG